MTNQEAIMRIKEHIRIHQICEPKAIKISEALDLAISALEFRDKYDQFWKEVKTAGMNGRETEIHHGGRVFRIKEVAQ